MPTNENLTLSEIDIETLSLDPFEYRVLHHLCFRSTPPNGQGDRLVVGRAAEQIAEHCMIGLNDTVDTLQILEDRSLIERREESVFLISSDLEPLFVEGGLK